MLRIMKFLTICGKGGTIKTNGKQYNNVIDYTLKHEQTEDSLSTARAIFNNMGVALPNGSMREVYEIIKTDNYMNWRSCTMQEAQQAADNGIAAIGISEKRIVVLSANNEEETITEISSVMALSENTSAFAISDLQYYSYSYNITCGGCGNTGNSCYTNKLFNHNNRINLLNDLISIMGNEQDLFSHYTTTECIDIILNYDSVITCYCNLYCVPKQLVQTLLLRELWCVDALDTAADDMVIAYFNWKQACEDWEKLSTAEQLIVPYPEAPIGIREDCSTGIGQMFAWVAINAHNLAISKGLIYTRIYDADNWHDRRDVWYALHTNNEFAIQMTTLEMHHCADYVGICGSLFDCTESQIKGILSRYNGTGDEAIDYGNECYEYYKIFKKYS